MRGILILLLLSVFSCNMICDVAKKASKVVSQHLSARWECKNLKSMELFLNKPLILICENKYFFQLEEEGYLSNSMCMLVANSFYEIGAREISKQFDCNLVKVINDFKNISMICQGVKI